jgi:hypothetical protein
VIILGWIIYFSAAVLIAGVATRFKNIRRIWPVGLATILFLYIIDSTLVNLGAYSFRYPNSLFGGVPILYLLSGFPGGTLLWLGQWLDATGKN